VALYPTGDGRLAKFALNEIGGNYHSITHDSPCSILRQRYSDLGRRLRNAAATGGQRGER
jgi:hypothetical protein